MILLCRSDGKNEKLRVLFFPQKLHGVMNCYIHSANAMMKANIKGRIIGAASIVAYK